MKVIWTGSDFVKPRVQKGSSFLHTILDERTPSIRLSSALRISNYPLKLLTSLADSTKGRDISENYYKWSLRKAET